MKYVSEDQVIIDEKGEFDVDQANGPRFGEFQVFASNPVVGGSVTWDFGDGFGSSQSSPSHIYAAPGTYNVSMTVNVPGACPATRITPVTVDDCGVLSIAHQLSGIYRADAVDNALTWRVIGEFQSARFQKFVDGGWQDISSNLASGDSLYYFFDKDIIWNAENVYRVQAFDNVGAQSFSNNVVLMPEKKPELGMIVFPNPVGTDHATLRIESTEALEVEAVLLDMYGRIVKQVAKGSFVSGTNDFEIPTTGISAGTYFVQILVNGKKHALKLVIVHQ